MSLIRKNELTTIAKGVCRTLRKDSTRAERILWEKIRGRRFLGLKFNRQHPLFVDIDGSESFVAADFYCHERRLGIELDGRIHKYQKERDVARTDVINGLGITVVRFDNEDVEQDITGALVALKKMIR